MDPPVVYTYVCVPLGDHNLADVLATVPAGGRLHSIYRDTVIFEVVGHWLDCDTCRGYHSPPTDPPKGTVLVSYGGGYLDPQGARQLAAALLAYADEKDGTP